MDKLGIMNHRYVINNYSNAEYLMYKILLLFYNKEWLSDIIHDEYNQSYLRSKGYTGGLTVSDALLYLKRQYMEMGSDI